MTEDDGAPDSPEGLEASVEEDVRKLKAFLALAWRKDPRYVQAMIDRLTLESLMDNVSRPRRRVYHIIGDYFDHALDDRQDADRASERQSDGRRGYLRRFLAGFDPEG